MGQTIHLAPGISRRSERGFTLIELVITLLILIVLTSVAAPAMREMNVRATVAGTTNDLVAALNLARSEAVKRGRNVSLVSVGGNWTDGWTIQDNAGTTLTEHAALGSGYRVLGAGIGAGAPADRVIFTATGALSVATGYDFSVCRPTFSPNTAQSRRVIVSATGMIRSRRDTTSAPAGTC